VIKSAILLRVSRPTVSNVILAYTNHVKTSSAKNSRGRKSTLKEKDGRTWGRIVSKIHGSTEELNIPLGYSVSTKTVRRELCKSNIQGRVVVAKPLITESNTQIHKRCQDHKT
jgi:hypothetical protein